MDPLDWWWVEEDSYMSPSCSHTLNTNKLTITPTEGEGEFPWLDDELDDKLDDDLFLIEASKSISEHQILEIASYVEDPSCKVQDNTSSKRVNHCQIQDLGLILQNVMPKKR